MQSILAESAAGRLRYTLAMIFATAAALTTLVLARPHHRWHHEHGYTHVGRCVEQLDFIRHGHEVYK